MLTFVRKDIHNSIADIVTNLLATVKEIAWQFFPLPAIFLLVESVSRGLVIT